MVCCSAYCAVGKMEEELKIITSRRKLFAWIDGEERKVANVATSSSMHHITRNTATLLPTCSNVLPIANWNAFTRVMPLCVAAAADCSLPQPPFSGCVFTFFASFDMIQSNAGVYFIPSFISHYALSLVFSLILCLARVFFLSAKYLSFCIIGLVYLRVCKFASSSEIYGRSTKSMYTRPLSSRRLLLVLLLVLFLNH